MSDPEHVIVPMTCVSEGAVDVYVEPGVQPRRVIVVGTTPVAEALARTALTLDYEVIRVVDAHEQGDLQQPAAAFGFTVAPLESLAAAVQEGGDSVAVVVASQGHYDEQALETVLRTGAAYVGLVASRKRGATVKNWLADNGVPSVERVRNPAGLDLGARTPPEVAVSILAEIVQTRPAQALDDRESGAHAESAVAIDPVCNMDVEVAGARHTAEVEGTTYYFCCARCRARFVQDPAAFLAGRS